MDLIKTGLELSQTIRNVSRLREIILVFAKKGFGGFISQKVVSLVPHLILPKSKKIQSELDEKNKAAWGQILGQRLRQCFEELGPTFIKFGQFLSLQRDSFDPLFIAEMNLLRNKAKKRSFSSVRPSVEKSLGQSLSSVFSSVEEDPLGTASIGLVFTGTLKNGDPVVLKVQRPGIEKEIKTDLSILKFLILQVEKISAEVRAFGLSRGVDDFSFSLLNELNFNTELSNAIRFKTLLKKHDVKNHFFIPKMHTDLCFKNLLVMERVHGIPFTDTALLKKKQHLEAQLDEAFKVLMRSFLHQDLFHADLHGGNFFLLDNGQIGLVDFGLMGSLSKRGRQSFVAILYALVTFNYENLVLEFLDVADYDTIPDINQLVTDVRQALSNFVGRSSRQSDFTSVMAAMMRALKKHQIFLPREWFAFFRGLAALENVAHSLDMNFDIYATIEGEIDPIVKNLFNKDDLIEEALWAGRDLVSLSRMVPRHFKWFLKDWSKKGHAHELLLKGHEKPLKGVAASLDFLALSLLASVFIVSGLLFFPKTPPSLPEVPTLTWIFWGLGTLFLAKGFWARRR